MRIERVRVFNENFPSRGRFVLYWCRAGQRVDGNLTLKAAVETANKRNLSLLVLFCLTDFPEASKGHYRFMLRGMQELSSSYEDLRIPFIVKKTNRPVETVLKIAEDCSCVFIDKGYSKVHRNWDGELIYRIEKTVCQVEDNVTVPVEIVSDKEEYSAATIRKKIWRVLPDFLFSFELPELKKKMDFDMKSDLDEFLKNVPGKGEEYPALRFKGGEREAQRLLYEFIEKKLPDYGEKRNVPEEDGCSNLSPYLHFGQISPVKIALEILKYKEEYPDSVSSFLDEMVVRRELARNFVSYQPHYDHPRCLHQWAFRSLKEHEKDPRPYHYEYETLERGETHDPYWNAAQLEMVLTGKMSGYMRMYWGKKIMEWTPDMETAWKWTLKLNNRYELDGRDPNGYAGVAWLFGKHDRAWKERPIFGKVRYMNAKGLERKFNIGKYVAKVNALKEKLK